MPEKTADAASEAHFAHNRREEFEIRSAYQPRKAVRTNTGSKSEVQQSMAKACDINNIMKRFEQTGLIDHVNQFQGDYGDFTGTPTFEEALQRVVAAQQMFEQLPAALRAEFANDPALFIDYVSDPENEADMRERGLLPKQMETGPGEGAPGGSPELPPGTPEPGGETPPEPAE